MAEVPQNGKPISDFSAGTLTASSLFYLSYPSAVGMSSGKISAAELGEGMGDNVEYEGLNSGDKTLFGAINEALAVSTENAVLITETFGPGSTGAIITDSRIKEDSIIDVYTDKYGVVPENVVAGSGSVTITMPLHSDTIVVALLLRGVSESGGETGEIRELIFESTSISQPATEGVTYTLSEAISNFSYLEIWFTSPNVGTSGLYGIDTICPSAILDDGCKVAFTGNVKKNWDGAAKERYYTLSFTDTTFTKTGGGAVNEGATALPSVWRIYGVR